MKGVMRFGKKGKLSPRYVGLYQIFQKYRQVAYKLEFHPELEVLHPVFHVHMLHKCLGDPFHITHIEDVQMTKD
ncbi:hypothetical protein RND71_005641 [Anisodus tanguticus]|uniref:Tf2-1-like SH3-like domain-containing protein n=1 Tax=Anisodus tanguticus TaxID=243964 RepID=A0AAE1VV56_9SOLA|nr:hypothetical protein RND71_005641 [Anisodus tanguticus]